MKSIQVMITLSTTGYDEIERVTYPIEFDYEYDCAITNDFLKEFYKREMNAETFDLDSLSDDEYEKIENFAKDYYYDDAYEDWYLSQLTAKDLY